MAFVYSANLLPTTTAGAFYALKTILRSVGWVVAASSDGTAYSANSDVITKGTGGSGGLANASAWFVVRSPFGNGAFCMQRGASNDAWRLKYSPAAGFVTGGDATHTPSGADEIAFRGGGTDSSPTFEASIFGATEGGQRVHLAAGDAVEAAPFYMISLDQGTNTIAAAFVRDGMAFPASRLAGDVDATVFYFGNKNSQILRNEVSGYGACFGLLGGAMRTVQAGKQTNGLPSGGLIIPNGLDPSAIASQRSPYVLWERGGAQSAPLGVKGYSNMLRWLGIAPATNGDLDASGRVQWGNFSFPWQPSLARPTP